MQKSGKIGCGTALVFGVVALCLLPAACSALSGAPDVYVPPQQVVHHHDTVVVVPPGAPAPRVTVTKKMTAPPKATPRVAPKVPLQKAPRKK